MIEKKKRLRHAPLAEAVSTLAHEEGHTFAWLRAGVGQCARGQRLACAWRAEEQHAFGRRDAEVLEEFRVEEREHNHLFEAAHVRVQPTHRVPFDLVVKVDRIHIRQRILLLAQRSGLQIEGLKAVDGSDLVDLFPPAVPFLAFKSALRVARTIRRGVPVARATTAARAPRRSSMPPPDGRVDGAPSRFRR